MVNYWFTEFEFCCGGTSKSDAEYSGCSIEVATIETIENIHDIMWADQLMKVREILKAIGMSHG